MLTAVQPIIPSSWMEQLHDEFAAAYFHELNYFLESEIQAGKVIYPPLPSIFSAFNQTPFEQVNVVILGQDPYHGPKQAHGLSFSVPEGIPLPPSLLNIYKELNHEFGWPISRNGNLEKWTQQGVLLLNSTLTVEGNKPGSHQKKGWEILTDEVIRRLSEQRDGIIFLLWGKFAQAKEPLIDAERHYILKAAHPSPFSAYRGFFGCNHFKTTNDLLVKQNRSAIDWRIDG